jgi:hypothetical protein
LMRSKMRLGFQDRQLVRLARRPGLVGGIQAEEQPLHVVMVDLALGAPSP